MCKPQWTGQEGKCGEKGAVLIWGTWCLLPCYLLNVHRWRQGSGGDCVSWVGAVKLGVICEPGSWRLVRSPGGKYELRGQLPRAGPHGGSYQWVGPQVSKGEHPQKEVTI